MRAHLLLPACLAIAACGKPEGEGVVSPLDTARVDLSPIVPQSCLTRAADAEGTVVYVMADAPEGGDGTAARPFRVLQDAVDSADGATTVLVAPGAYARGFRATDPRRHARLAVLGCEPQGAVLKDNVLVAGRGDARLGRVELADLRINATIALRDVSDLELRDLVVDNYLGGSSIDGASVAIRGAMTLRTAGSSAGALLVVDSDVHVDGDVVVEAGHEENVVGIQGALLFLACDVVGAGSISVTTFGGDAETWAAAPALGFYQSTARVSGTVEVSGPAIGLYLEDSDVAFGGPTDIASDLLGPALLVRSNVFLEGAWRLANVDAGYAAVDLNDASLRATGAGSVEGWVAVNEGANVLDAVTVEPHGDLGLGVSGGELVLHGAVRVQGRPGVLGWGVQLIDGASLLSAPGSTLDVEDADGALLVVGGTATVEGFRTRGIAGAAVTSTGPVTGVGWVLEDVGGLAVDADGADIVLTDVVVRGSTGVRMVDGQLTLRDVRFEAPAGEPAVVRVEGGTLDAERVALVDVPDTGVALVGSGGRLVEVSVSGARRALVRTGCAEGVAPLEVVGLTCEACDEPAVERCDGGAP